MENIIEDFKKQSDVEDRIIKNIKIKFPKKLLNSGGNMVLELFWWLSKIC
ncbi:hypothetical protein GQR36_16090 [Enterococcus termitis]